MRAAFLFLILAASAFADLGGEYAGTSVSEDGEHTAKIHLSLKKNADAKWDCKFSFNYEGDDVSTKTISCNVENSKVSGEYSAEVQGTQMRIVLEGKPKEDKSIEGTYKTVGDEGGDAISQGTWKASPQQ